MHEYGPKDAEIIVFANIEMSFVGWLMVCNYGIENDGHWWGALLFSAGYIGMFPFAIPCHPQAEGLLWLLYGMAVVFDVLFAVFVTMKVYDVAYCFEWNSLLLFEMSLLVYTVLF